MNLRAIRPGDLVEVDIKGLPFPAVVRSKQPRNIGIEPCDPIRFSYRHCSPRQVKRRLERRAASDVAQPLRELGATP